MRATTLMTLAAVTIVADLVVSAPAAAQVLDGDSVQARVWLDRGDEPVVEYGDEVRVYYRTSHDAYAAIFRIDTDGMIRLLFPQHPDADAFVSGGRDYRLLFPDGPRWRVREDPGAGYFFMVASPDPLDFSAFGYDVDHGWDLSPVGETVYEDPYVAIDEYVAVILPDWEYVPYGLDFLEYSVGERQSYPRFLCYDCHDFRRYSRWNPYDYSCSSYQVVIWDDPYFYPRYRYFGPNIVVARPFGPRPRYTVTTRVRSGWAPIVRRRPPPPRRIAEYKEPAREPSFSPRNPRRRPSRVVPSTNPSSRNRAGGAVTTPTNRRPTSVGGAVGRRARPSLERRPSSPSATRSGRVTGVPSSSPRPSVSTRNTPRSSGAGVRAPSQSRPTTRPTPQRARAVPSPGSNPRGGVRRPTAARSSPRPSASGATRSRPNAPRATSVRPPGRGGSAGRVSRPPPTSRSSGSARGARPSGPRPTGRANRPPRRPNRRPGG